MARQFPCIFVPSHSPLQRQTQHKRVLFPVTVPIPRAPSITLAGPAMMHFIRIEHAARIFRVEDAMRIYFK